MIKYEWLVFIVLCFSVDLHSQKGESKIVIDKSKSCSYLFGYSTYRDTVLLEENIIDETFEIIKNILDYVGLLPNFELAVGNVSNAMATVVDGKRYIIYDPSFLSSINKKINSDYVNYSILAHEIGHHLLGHTFMDSSNDRYRLELEADYWSGFILYKIGASLKEAQKVIELEAPEISIGFYPSQDERLNSIKQGWLKAKSQGAKRRKRQRHIPEVGNEVYPPSQRNDDMIDLSNEHVTRIQSDNPPLENDIINDEPNTFKSNNSRSTNEIVSNFTSPSVRVEITGGAYHFLHIETPTNNFVDSIITLPEVEIFDLNLPINIELGSGHENNIIIHGDINLIRMIDVQLSGKRITLRMKRPGSYNFYGTKVVLNLAKLNTILSSGTGSIRSDVRKQLKFNSLNIISSGTGDILLNIDANYLKINSSGTGDVLLEGKAKTMDLTVGGTSNVNCTKLDVKVCSIYTSGTGGINLRVSELLKGQIGEFTKHLEYYGNPILDLINLKNRPVIQIK